MPDSTKELEAQLDSARLREQQHRQVAMRLEHQREAAVRLEQQRESAMRLEQQMFAMRHEQQRELYREEEMTRQEASELRSQADEATRLRMNQLMIDARSTPLPSTSESRENLARQIELDQYAQTLRVGTPSGVYERALACYTMEMRQSTSGPSANIGNAPHIRLSHNAQSPAMLMDVTPH